MIERIKDEHLDTLFKAILSLRTVEELYAFFDDLCTVSEVSEMSKRFLAARLLESGAVYSDISHITGLSSATISRVNRSLRYGSGGYVSAINNLKEDDR